MIKILYVEDNDIIHSGDILITEAGDKYVLIVTGDVNQDGDVGIRDLIRVRRTLLGELQLSEIEELSADSNNDNKINIRDIVRIRKIILTKSINV